MGPEKAARAISQDAFDEIVKENMEDLDMDPTEALQDAIDTLTLQGVDLSGIVTCVPGDNVRNNPVILCLDRLTESQSKIATTSNDRIDDNDFDELVELIDELSQLCSLEGTGNAAIANKNGAVELLCAVLSKIPIRSDLVFISVFRAMALTLNDIQSTEIFRKSGGPPTVIRIIRDKMENVGILNCAFAVVAAAATSNEVVKESFMELKVDELILEALDRPNKDSIHGVFDAIRVLLTPDDNRVVASQVFGYARRFGKIGIAASLVDSLRLGLASPSLVSASIALKAVAVNEEICKSIAENGGIDAVLQCIDDSSEQGNPIVAKTCCSLLSKLAGSDTNKSAIAEKGGFDRLIKLSNRLFDDPSVLQEVMSIIAVLCLRNPDNAARAIEAGAGDLAIQSMQTYPAAHQMQRSACIMIRNLAVRNPQNRTIMLNNGVEKIIRQTKQNHESCKDAATDALRDLGLDNYNL